jgi:glycosyltransferase involved in cell wall biosynthesis
MADTRLTHRSLTGIRVAFLTVSKLSFRGGVERWIVAAARLLASEGARVEVLCPEDPSLEPTDGHDDFLERPFQSWLYRILRRVSLLNLFPLLLIPPSLENYDVVYCPSFYSMFPLLLWRGRLVYGTHDAFIPASREGWQEKSLAVPAMLLRMCASSHDVTVHAISPLVAAQMARRGVPTALADNSFLLPNLPADWRSGEPGTRFRVLFTGRLDLRKGLPILSEMSRRLRQFPDVSLDVIGSVPLAAKGWAATAAEGSRIVVHGYVSEDHKLQLLRTANLVLHLSDREVAPAVIDEALWTGVPVISTWSPVSDAVSELMSYVEVVRRAPQSVLDGVAAAAERWRSSPRKYLEAQQALFRQVRMVFDPDRSAVALSSLFLVRTELAGRERVGLST